jgi:hypothetical protein
MEKKGVLTKILAIVGMVLVWLPILAPVVFMVIKLTQGGEFNFDFLMPAELFPVVLLGGALLIWAALRSRLWIRFTTWSLVTAVILLIGGQGIAVATGLASGEIEAVGWQWALVVATFIFYFIAVIVLGVSGILLVIGQFRSRPQPSSNA